MSGMPSAYCYVNGILDAARILLQIADMADEKDPRIITPMPPELVAQIDDYRFKQRINSRAEAIRQLIQRGLSGQSE